MSENAPESQTGIRTGLAGYVIPEAVYDPIRIIAGVRECGHSNCFGETRPGIEDGKLEYEDELSLAAACAGA